MIDSHPSRTTEIIRDGENFIRRLALAEQPLRVRTCRANRKQFRRDANKAREQQLLTVEFRPKPRHRMKQTARESFARARRVIDMALQRRMQIVDLTCTVQ